MVLMHCVNELMESAASLVGAGPHGVVGGLQGRGQGSLRARHRGRRRGPYR